jgi:hypothetical protein
MWFNILKVQESISDIGLDFESPDEKLEPKDKDCCEIAKNTYKEAYMKITTWTEDEIEEVSEEWGMTFSDYTTLTEIYDDFVKYKVFTNWLKEASCEEFKEYISDPDGPMAYATWKPEMQKILDEWDRCEHNERGEFYETQ